MYNNIIFITMICICGYLNILKKLSHVRFKKRNADNNKENCLIIQKLYAVGRNVLTPKRKKSYKIIIVFYLYDNLFSVK